MKTKQQLFEHRVRQIVKEELMKENSRIEDISDINTLNKFKQLFRMLVTDWKQDGFEDGDILKYLQSLIRIF